MRAVVIDEYGGADKMKLAEVPNVKPKPGEVMIKVEYAGVNPVDWKIREGWLKKRLICLFPLVLGFDVSGVVVELGEGVSNWQIGDEVFAHCRQDIFQYGTFAEYCCFDARHVVLKPKNLSFSEAASLPLISLTAWQALFETAYLSPGELVLIHAGAGGVGGMATQLAKYVGATVITTARETNHSYVKSLGADVAIDYSKESFSDAILRLYPQGVDLVLDCVGDTTFETSFPTIRQGGMLISVGRVWGPVSSVPEGINVRYVVTRADGVQLKKIAELFEKGVLQPPFIQEYSFEDAPKALEDNRMGHSRGKIVLKIS